MPRTNLPAKATPTDTPWFITVCQRQMARYCVDQEPDAPAITFRITASNCLFQAAEDT